MNQTDKDRVPLSELLKQVAKWMNDLPAERQWTLETLESFIEFGDGVITVKTPDREKFYRWIAATGLEVKCIFDGANSSWYQFINDFWGDDQ